MSEIFIIKNTGKGVINSLAPENVVPIKSAGSSDGGVITEDSDTVAFTGNGTAGNPLSAESVGGETLTAEQIKALYESNANTNAFTDNEKTKLAGLENFDPTPINEQLALKANQLTTYTKMEVDATISAMNTALGLKVDKIEGKGLSESDFTSAEKTKLSEIATGANNYVLPATSGTILGGVKEVYLTQSAYDALTPKLTDVKYHIEKI